MDCAFVRASGSSFTLNGQPFRVAGANNYYLGFAADSMVVSVFDLAAQLGLNTLRTWAFLDADQLADPCFQYRDAATGWPAYNDGPTGLERLDRTIFLAGQYGIRLILPLVNYWDDFGGVAQYLRWFGFVGRDRFYTHPQLTGAFRNYIGHLLLRVNTCTGRQYRDEPAILAWELANEPRSDKDTTPLLCWAAEMSLFIRSLDPNHLIAVGDEGHCEALLRLPNIDFGTFHLYPPPESTEPASFGKSRIARHIEAGRRTGKPVLLEEYGVRSEAGNTYRDAVFKTWLDEVVNQQGAGALVWMIAAQGPEGDQYPDYDGYTVYRAQDVPSICAFARGA